MISNPKHGWCNFKLRTFEGTPSYLTDVPVDLLKAFIDLHVEERFKELVKIKCKELEIEIIAIECDKDHSHMFLNCLPTLSPSDIMQQIKGYTSKILREEFSELSKMPSLWTRSYFVSTAGNVCSETIKKYVENQKKRY